MGVRALEQKNDPCETRGSRTCIRCDLEAAFLKDSPVEMEPLSHV